jgi:hypothetical protein
MGNDNALVESYWLLVLSGMKMRRISVRPGNGLTNSNREQD